MTKIIVKSDEGPKSVMAEWLNDPMYPRLFEVIESDHPYIFPGDKIYVVVGKLQEDE